MELATELDLALALADLADAVTLPRFQRQDFILGWKDDRTEVTEADREAEATLAAQVQRARPDHGFFGEEFGHQGDRDSPWQWIVDPIDGTSGFVRGIPVWGSLIALTYGGEVVIGVVSAPALERRWSAARGVGSFAGDRRCQVSGVTALADAQVSVTLNAGWDALGLTGELVKIQQEARRARGFGDFWQHCLVAEGALDLAIDAVGVAPYDLAAVRVIVEEAGGTFTDRHGAATHEHDTAISSNGHLHLPVLERLALASQRES